MPAVTPRLTGSVIIPNTPCPIEATLTRLAQVLIFLGLFTVKETKTTQDFTVAFSTDCKVPSCNSLRSFSLTSMISPETSL